MMNISKGKGREEVLSPRSSPAAAPDCTQWETRRTLSTFPPIELQAQGKLSNLQDLGPFFVPLPSPPPHPPFDNHGKKD